MLNRVISACASLKLSIVLLSLAMVLVYAGTWAQIDMGIYDVQRRYFHAWITVVPLGVFLPRLATGAMAVPGAIAMPGGYLIGLVMLVNLLANWFTRYRWTWGQLGLHLIHLALVLLLVGEAWTSVAQRDTRMMLSNGQTKDYSEDIRLMELAVIDPSPKDRDQVWTMRSDLLRTGQELGKEEGLPIGLKIDEYAVNSELLGSFHAGEKANPKASAGAGVGVTMVPLRPSSGVGGQVDVPSAYVTVSEGGKAIGKYLLSAQPPADEPQKVTLGDGREFFLQLRPKRVGMPYQITLLEFRHDRYPGTQTPRNFSSRVRLVDRERNVDREEVIWMNHPLRYRGETYYQASFAGEDTTVLQVVRNPASVVPYVACGIGFVGMVVQFGRGLVVFLGRRAERPAREKSKRRRGEATGWAGVTVPLCVGLACVSVVVYQAHRSSVDGNDVAAAPVYFEGRLQPIDSVARNTLRAMNGKASATTPDGKTVDAAQWLLDVLAPREVALEYATFRIDNGDVLSMLKLDAKRNRFSVEELGQVFPELRRQAAKAQGVAASERDMVQRHVLELYGKVMLFSGITDRLSLYLLPPTTANGEWRPLSAGIPQAASEPVTEATAVAIEGALETYRQKGPAAMSEVGRQWLGVLDKTRPADMAKMRIEVFYNRYEPFIVAMGLFVVAFVLAAASLLGAKTTLWRSAMIVAGIAFVEQTLAMGARVYLQGRPPVTNLYSSAIFIGWGAVLLALGLEWIYRNGIALAMSSLVATASLVVAQNLAQGGDTMPSMQAVLDSNFWLTTHVLAITYGYSAAFVAGAMGVAFVAAGMFARKWFDDQRQEQLGRMIYGVACFAMVFSFVGTLLGGIWADQSWGRFWGWDPKENGAALIVLWLSIMLHARFVGAKARGIAILAVFANVVTAWSWFGTNMLGVGLHSYGFMDKALMWLLAFVGSQLLVILAGWGLIPRRVTAHPRSALAGEQMNKRAGTLE